MADNLRNVRDKIEKNEQYSFRTVAMGFDKREVSLYISTQKRNFEKAKQQYEVQIELLARKSASDNDGVIQAAGVAGSDDPKVIISQLEDKIIGLEKQLFQSTHSAGNVSTEAHENADKFIDEAKKKAEQMLSGVKKRADSIELEARKKAGYIVAEAEKTLETARKEAADIVKNATALASASASVASPVPENTDALSDEECIARLDDAVRILQKAFDAYTGVPHAAETAVAAVPTATPVEEGDAFFDKYTAAVKSETQGELPAMGIIGNGEAVEVVEKNTCPDSET